jgi:hypothetical protein
MPNLDKDLKAYQAQKSELEAHHKGKWVVIRDGEVVGTFDQFQTAAAEAVSRFGRGPYLIRQIGAPDIVLPASVVYRLEPEHA